MNFNQFRFPLCIPFSVNSLPTYVSRVWRSPESRCASVDVLACAVDFLPVSFWGFYFSVLVVKIALFCLPRKYFYAFLQVTSTCYILVCFVMFSNEHCSQFVWQASRFLPRQCSRCEYFKPEAALQQSEHEPDMIVPFLCLSVSCRWICNSRCLVSCLLGAEIRVNFLLLWVVPPNRTCTKGKFVLQYVQGARSWKKTMVKFCWAKKKKQQNNRGQNVRFALFANWA